MLDGPISSDLPGGGVLPQLWVEGKVTPKPVSKPLSVALLKVRPAVPLLKETEAVHEVGSGIFDCVAEKLPFASAVVSMCPVTVVVVPFSVTLNE
jgi:transposase